MQFAVAGQGAKTGSGQMTKESAVGKEKENDEGLIEIITAWGSQMDDTATPARLSSSARRIMNVESPATPPPGLSHTSAIVTGPPVRRIGTCSSTRACHAHAQRETSARVLIADNVHMGLSKLPLIGLD